MEFTKDQKNLLMVVVIVGVVLTGGGWYYHLMFGSKAASDYEGRARRETTRIAEAKVELRVMQALIAEKDLLEERKVQILKLKERLPDREGEVEFYRVLNETLDTTDILHKGLRRVAKRENRGSYTEIPYRVSAVGRYHDFGQFLTIIEQNPDRFMRVKEFTIKNDAKRPSIHPIELQINTFMFNR